MTLDMTTTEQRLRNTARLAHQSMWLLFVIAAGLMLVLRHSAPARTGSIWILGLAVLAFMFSFAMRDAVKKLGHRNTENRIVRDVKVFLETAPALPVVQPQAAAVEPAIPAEEVPTRPAGFVFLNGTTAYRTSAADPVVFDAMPLRAPVAVRAEFFAVLMPVVTN